MNEPTDYWMEASGVKSCWITTNSTAWPFNVAVNPTKGERGENFGVNSREVSCTTISEADSAENFMAVRLILNKKWTTRVALLKTIYFTS